MCTRVGGATRTSRPTGIMVFWQNGKVTLTLIDWAGSCLCSEGRHPTRTCFDTCLLLASPSINSVCCMAFTQVWHLNELMSAISSVILRPMCTVKSIQAAQASPQLCIKQQQWMCHRLHCLYASSNNNSGCVIVCIACTPQIT